MTSSTLRFAFGALSIVETPTEPDEVDSVGSMVIAEAVTSTDSTTASTSNSMSTRTGVSSAGTQTMSLCPLRPGEVPETK